MRHRPVSLPGFALATAISLPAGLLAAPTAEHPASAHTLPAPAISSLTVFAARTANL